MKTIDLRGMMLKRDASDRRIKGPGDLAGLQVERSAIIERAAVDSENRTVQLAFASETPCERWFGFEILDCKSSSIRLDRLTSGGPLLVGHDSDDQVGVVESVTVGEDGFCRATCRLSRSERGEEILQDIVDGIRRNVSVGYMVHEAVLERQDKTGDYYRVTDWEPYEVSIVPMPADTSVGVGRSMEEAITEPAAPATETPTEETRTMIKCKHCGAELAEGATCTCHAVRAAEQARIAAVMTRAAEFSARGGVEVATTLLKENPSATVDDFNARMLAKITETQAPTVPREPEKRTPSITQSLRYEPTSLNAWKRHGSRAEEIAYRAGIWAKAVLFGDVAAQRQGKDMGLDLRVMTEGTATAGGYLVPEEMETGIIDLRAQYGALRRIAQLFPMGSGTLPIPKWASGATAYFAGEETATTASDAALGNVLLVAKEVSALTRYSQSLAEDAIIDMAAFIANEHAYAFAVKEDSCFIDGDGTSTYGGIVGLKALLETSGMAGIYTAATNTDTPAEVIAAELAMVIAKLPSYARMGARWLCSPAFEAAIIGRLKLAGGGNTIQTIGGAIVEQGMAGYPVTVCEPCYSSLTDDLTGKAMLFFGNFQQGVALGERRGITVQVLRERYAEYRQIGVIGTERIDINCHGVGTTSAAGPIVALIGG